jgi:hypothetical protein
LATASFHLLTYFEGGNVWPHPGVTLYDSSTTQKGDKMKKTVGATVGGAAIIVAGLIVTIQPAFAGASSDGTDGSGHNAPVSVERHIPVVPVMKIGTTSTASLPPLAKDAPSSFAPTITPVQVAPPS